MPDRIYSIQYNGRVYEVRAPDTSTPDDLFSFVRQQAGGEGPKEKEAAGFFGSLSEAATQFPSIADEVAAYTANPNDATRRALIKAGESKYRQVGFGEGENWEAFKQLLGGSLGQLAAPVAAGLAGSAVTTPIGGLVAAGVTSEAQYTAQNLLRQAQEQERAIQEGRTPEEASLGKAVMAATGQTALDLAGGPVFGKLAKAFPFMRPLLGSAGSKAAKEAGEVLEDAISKGTVTFAGNVARGVGKGVGFEVPQEIVQQGLERWQAGLGVNPFTDKEAADEYTQAAVGALLLGGGFGAVEGALHPRTKAIQSDEEILSERKGLEDEIAATGFPEVADPSIRTRAAEIVQSTGLDVTTAVEMAIDQQKETEAKLQRAEGTDVAQEPDTGGGEPDISGAGAPVAAGEPAGAPAGVGGGPVGGTGLPAGQPVAGEAEVKSPLEPQGIIPPIETITPQAQFAQQMGNAPGTFRTTVDINGVEQVSEGALPRPTVPEAAPVAPPAPMALPEAKKLVTPERISAATEMLNTTLATPDFEGFEVTPKDVNKAAQQMARTPGLDAPSALFKVLGMEQAVADEAAFEAAPVPEPAPIPEVAPPPEAAPAPDLNTQIDEYTSFVAKGQLAPAPLVEDIARQYVGAMQTTGIEGLISPDRIPAFSQFVGNEINTVNSFIEEAKQAAPAPEKAPEQKVSEIAGTPEQNVPAPTTVEETPPTVAETVTVAKIDPTLPEDVQAAQAEVNQYNPGFEIRYNAENGRRRYSYGVLGGKTTFASPNLESVKNRILNEKPIQPKKVIEGVPVKQLPAGEAKGLEKPKRTMTLQPEVASQAGKLSRSQEQQQQLLLHEIDEARKARQITDAQRTELVQMLRTPQGKELARSREWTIASSIQNDLDALTAQGKALRAEERLAKEQNNLTPAKRREFTKRAKDIAKRTKEQEARLAEAKIGIYQRTREALAKAKAKPAEEAAKLKESLENKKITPQQYKRMVRDLLPPTMFRKAQSKAAGITLEELNTAVKDITSRWNARIEPKLVQSASDLPPAIRKELEDLDRTDAYGFYKDGKAYLIADNMNGVEDVAPTLYHEALGHLGLRERFREGLDNILTGIYRSNPRVRQLADKWLSANKDLYAAEENPTARAVEEVLATASESGPLSASRFDKLVNYIKDFARKYLGLDFKFSDREVRTILAMAHEQALSGEGTVMGSSSTMFSTPEQNEADQEAAKATVSAQDAIEKIATTTADRVDPELYARSTLGNIAESFKAKNVKNWLKSLTPNSVSRGFIGRGGLNFLPTDGMLNYADTKIGKNVTTRELRAANDAAVKMNGTRAATRRLLSRTVIDLKTYLTNTGDNSLALAMDYGNYYNMDMVAFTEGMTREEAYKTDSIWRRYNKLLQKTDLTAAVRKDYEGKLESRQAEIDGGMDVWSKVKPEGRKLYKRVRDMHRDMYQTRQYLMKKYIENLKDAGMSDEAVGKMLIAYRQQQERLNDTVNAPSAEDAHKLYKEVPLGLFHREYFPKRRYGQYWLRIKKSKFGEPILRFYEDMAERDADWEAAAEELGVSKNDSSYFTLGNNVKVEYNEFDGINTNTAFNKALNLISGIDPESFSEAKKTQLQNDVYQLLLMGAPEGSVRKQFIKSKNRLGWSSDILRTVGATAEEYASDIARLRYAPDIDRALTSAKKSIAPEPGVENVGASDALTARDFITNLEMRIKGSMEPQTESLATKIVPWMNEWAYLSFLTAPATAAVQLIALPMNVAPHLWGKYGMTATTRAMGRYMNVFSNRPKLESTDTKGRKSFRLPTLLESEKLKSSKRHRDALLRATNEYGVIIPLSEFTMHNERTPQTAVQGRKAEVMRKSYDAMTYLFDTTEQLTREVAFMATYDLEYDRLANKGLSAEDRQNRAIIAAKNAVNARLGDYSNLNRPPVMKSNELAKALFLFKQYSVIMTKFFVESTRAIFGKNTPREERVAAMKEMTGVLSMGFLIGGLKGLPLYTLGMMALQALQDALDDDDDRKERMKQNPITADSVELQFRMEWLPEHFGQPMTTDASGKKISLGDMILNGALSEATGWNFGSRTSLDVAGMWFRSPKDADTWTQTVNNALVENIPGASASLNIVSMGEELSKGNVLEGLELGMPALLRSPFKAYRLATEGLRTQTEKIKLHKEEISNAEIIGAVLGFNPTQIAKVQQKNRDILGRFKELQQQKSELLGAYKQAVRRIQNGDPDGQAEAKKAFKDIMEYNRKVGNPYFGISYSNIYKSLTGAAAEEKYDIQGMGLDRIQSYYVQQMENK